MKYKNTKGTYVIAEIGINHNGDVTAAKKLIKAAVKAGADGIKIQVRDLESIYTKKVLEDSLTAEQSTQYLLNELRKAHLTFDQVRELFAYARKFKVDFFATPFDTTSAHFLHTLGVELFKIGSPDMTNLPLLEVVAGFGKPMIVSTGMSEESEIAQVVDFLKSKKADFALLHCNSTYPASYGTINLRYLKTMREGFGVPIGYSGHEQGYAPTLAAVALGAEIIERHLTLDTKHLGPDHRSSLMPKDFGDMVRDIRIVEASLGQPRREYLQGEKSNRLSLAKSLVAARDLAAGTVLGTEDIVAKTPARGVSPLNLNLFVGKKLAKNIKTDEYLLPEHLQKAGAALPSTYQFNKTWGVVGRLNDFRDYLEFKPDLVEIHLTWRDIFEYKRPAETFKQDLVVHAPEYFKDRLIDYTSPDPEVTAYSLDMLQKAIALARDLAPQFKGQKDSRGPRLVVHPGGHFSTPTDSNKADQYRLLKERLRSIDSSGVRILVENMPPEPWYFGGQWHNTIFMDGKEISQFAEEIGWGICYDTSHAGLYCNSAGISFADNTKAVLDHIAYMHVSDARGTTEEGLQIGKGTLDFEQFFTIVSKIDTGFIPEIWQGHLNRGEGFRDALTSLEGILKKVSGTSCSSKTCKEQSHSHHIKKSRSQS